MKFVISIWSVLFVSNQAAAFGLDVVKLCLAYKTEYGWSKTYAVEGTIVDGQTLRMKTGEYAKYVPYAKYVAVFWSPEKVTMFRMSDSFSYFDRIYKAEMKDMVGNDWLVSTTVLTCN